MSRYDLHDLIFTVIDHDLRQSNLALSRSIAFFGFFEKILLCKRLGNNVFLASFLILDFVKYRVLNGGKLRSTYVHLLNFFIKNSF